MPWIDSLVHRADARLNTSTTPRPVEDDAPHAVVIGAGFGGLAAAIRLSVRGFQVTLVDRLEQAGGRARVFEQDGFAFDAGPTVITAPFLFEELWSLCGRNMADDVELRPVSPFYRIRFDDGTSFDYTADPEAMSREIARFSPEDVEGYRRFFEKSAEIFRIGFEELGHVPFGKVTDMLKIAPAMAALESYRTVYGLVSKYIKHEKIRQVLSFHPLLVGGNPFNVTSIYTLIAFLERKWGVHYAMGGTGSLVRGLVGLLKSRGVSIRLGEEVREITLDGQRATGVRLATGETIPADLVVSNADVAWTYRHLLPAHSRTRWTDARLDAARYSMSLFVWYFGTRRQYPDVAHHTILLGPRYKGLLEDIFEHKRLADDFSLYLHRPSATDPAMAPEGCDAFYVLSPVPHLDSGVDWSQQAERYRKAIESYLAMTVLPGLSESLATSRVLTPQGFLDDYLSFKGAAFSIEPVLTQSAYFRPHNASEDIDGLYFVGAGTHPGAGLPGVLSTARVLDTVVPDPAAIVGRNGTFAGAR
ncbi:MAG: phytoene desaturase [Rhodothermales bacterium]